MGKSKKPRKSRAKMASGLPKGAYRVPGGGVVREVRGGVPAGGERKLVVRSVMREQPDIRKLALVVQALAEAQIAREQREAAERGLEVSASDPAT